MYRLRLYLCDATCWLSNRTRWHDPTWSDMFIWPPWPRDWKTCWQSRETNANLDCLYQLPITTDICGNLVWFVFGQASLNCHMSQVQVQYPGVVMNIMNQWHCGTYDGEIIKVRSRSWASLRGGDHRSFPTGVPSCPGSMSLKMFEVLRCLKS